MSLERLSVDPQLAQEISSLIDSGQLPSAFFEKSIEVLTANSRHKQKTLEDYNQWLDTTWKVLLNQNSDLLTPRGRVREIGSNTFAGKVVEGGLTTLCIRTVQDIDHEREENYSLKFEADWAGGLKTPEKVTLVRLVKSKEDGDVVLGESISFDFRTGEFELS
jgi:hypothetical protein